MTKEEKKKAAQRFVADGDGMKVERPNDLPDWNKILKEAEKKNKKK